MRFKEWLEISEMAHFIMQEPMFSYNGQLVYMADMRFEDNPATNHLNQGSSFIVDLKKAVKEDPNISMIQGPWLIYSGHDFKARVGEPNEEERQYEKIPPGWTRYAEFYNKNYQPVKEAEYDAVKRLGVA